MDLSATVLYAGNSRNTNTGDDGLTNYSEMKNVATDGTHPNCAKHWPNCVINTAAEINEKGKWYVPARIELHALMFYMYNFKTAFLSNDVNWWSATCVGALDNTNRYYSNNSIFDDVNENDLYKYKDLKAEIGFQYRVRQATQVQPVKNE